MAQIKIDIADYKIEGYELTKIHGTNTFTLIFSVGLYNEEDELITTVNFSSEGMLGHKFLPTDDINDKARELLVSIDEIVSENFVNIKGGTTI